MNWRKPLLGPYRVEITAEAVIQTSAHRQIRAQWQGVYEVIADADAVCFDSGYAGQIVVPRRVFRNDEAYWTFVRLAREFRDSATGQ